MTERPDFSSFDSIVDVSLSDVKDRVDVGAEDIAHQEEVFGLLPGQFKTPDIGDPYADERSDDGDSN